MAAIIKRKRTYSVVFSYVDENGETKQKWETLHTFEEAKKRKAEVESQQFTGYFVPPKKLTVEDFLVDFVSIYGEKSWGIATYDGNVAMIKNYIVPIIGKVEVQEVNARMVDQLIRTLQKTESVFQHKISDNYFFLDCFCYPNRGHQKPLYRFRTKLRIQH